MSKEGISIDPDKIALIVNTPRPTTITGVRSFVSLGNYYRRCVENFVKIAGLLTNLLKNLRREKVLSGYRNVKKRSSN